MAERFFICLLQGRDMEHGGDHPVCDVRCVRVRVCVLCVYTCTSVRVCKRCVSSFEARARRQIERSHDCVCFIFATHMRTRIYKCNGTREAKRERGLSFTTQRTAEPDAHYYCIS